MDAETPTVSDTWHACLTTQGGQFTAPNRVTFITPGPAASDEAVTIMPLVHLAIVEVAGPDSATFLQGQTSAAIEQANGRTAPPTSFCTPKGRMIANAQLLQPAPERYWLLLDVSVAEALRAHLAKYAVFYKTELKLRNDLAIMGIAGPDAATHLQAQGIAAPTHAWSMRQDDDLVTTRHPGEPARFVLIGDAQRLCERWQALADTAIPRGNEAWQLRDIRAGLLWIGEAQRETLLPQMINWEALGGISFKKGCYTGQEVVARAHYRGQVKKRLLRFSAAGEHVPAPGTTLGDMEGKSQGEVMLAAPTPDGGSELLAVVTQKEALPALYVDSIPVTALALPYALERLDPETLPSD